MYRIMIFVLIVALCSGCGPAKMSPGDIDTQKKAIESLASGFWKAYEAKDLPVVTKLFTTSGDLLFYGTDSAEVIKTIPEWETQAKADWELFQSVKFGAMRNVSTILSDDGSLGAIVCEVPADITSGGHQEHSLFRTSMTLRKESGEWKLVSGMVAVATVGQSSVELVAKMKAETAKPPKK